MSKSFDIKIGGFCRILQEPETKKPRLQSRFIRKKFVFHPPAKCEKLKGDTIHEPVNNCE